MLAFQRKQGTFFEFGDISRDHDIQKIIYFLILFENDNI